MLTTRRYWIYDAIKYGGFLMGAILLYAATHLPPSWTHEHRSSVKYLVVGGLMLLALGACCTTGKQARSSDETLDAIRRAQEPGSTIRIRGR